MKEFINGTNLEFDDISTEEWRRYIYLDYEIIIEEPLKLNVSESGGHRVFDSNGVSHYIPAGWKHLQWRAYEGKPNFVK